ncbi:MAG: enoyl-CoA hydratase [Bradyrhizobium sp.]|nr:enoyl-CoA hydratase [Bradyrhizobium sp.]
MNPSEHARPLDPFGGIYRQLAALCADMEGQKMAVATVDVREGVAEVMLDHPPGNLIGRVLLDELLSTLETLDRAPPRAILLRAAGPDFCLGNDPADWNGMLTGALQGHLERFSRVVSALEGIAVPTIAVVQGECLASGFQLALSCDLIIAARGAQFGFPETAQGLPLFHAGLALLANRIGRSRATELALFGSAVDAEEMERLNVISRVVDDDRLEQEARALALRIAAGPTHAFASAKAVLRSWSLGGVCAARADLPDLAMTFYAAQVR